MLRIIILALAAIALVAFFRFGYMPTQWEILLTPLKEHRISYGSAFATAVLAPLLALGAIVLVTATWRPWLAITLIITAHLVFWGDMIPFAIGVMIIGA